MFSWHGTRCWELMARWKGLHPHSFPRASGLDSRAARPGTSSQASRRWNTRIVAQQQLTYKRVAVGVWGLVVAAASTGPAGFLLV